MRALDTTRVGGKRTRVVTRGAGEEGGAVRVAHGPLFRHGLREDEYDHDLEHRGDGDADRAEDLCRDDADQRGGDELAQKDEEQDGGQEGLRVLDQAAKRPGAPLTVVLQGLGAGARGASETGLGQGEDGRARYQHEHRREEGAVGAAEAVRAGDVATGEVATGEERYGDH